MAGNYNQSLMNDRKLVHVERIAIRWGDMDAMGHVNNTVYFRYMEQARISWFDTLKSKDPWRGTGVVVASTACNFKRPLNYPGTVEVRVPTFYELVIGDDVYAEGTATVVFIDLEKQKPVRIPQKIREAIQ
jgi:acyl-CoA thioester hydrolase